MLDEPSEKGVQQLPIVIAEGAEELVVQLCDCTFHVGERTPPVGSQVETVGSAVVASAAALEEASIFQSVDHPYGGRAIDAESTSDLALTAARHRVDEAEKPELPQRQAPLGHQSLANGRHATRRGPQEESRPRREAVVGRVHIVLRHSG
jgi:hypothetical protein